MRLCIRFLTTAVLVAGLGIAPAAHAQHRHGVAGITIIMVAGIIIMVVVATPLARQS